MNKDYIVCSKVNRRSMIFGCSLLIDSVRYGGLRIWDVISHPYVFSLPLAATASSIHFQFDYFFLSIFHWVCYI